MSINPVTPTRCPNCGRMEASTVCSICKTDKVFTHHDDGDRDRVYQERDLTTWGALLVPGR